LVAEFRIAFPAITAAFPSATRAALSWVLNAYAIVFAALLITAGRLADQLGRRRVFLAGLGIFAATSAACGLAPTLPILVAGRALQAVGAALLVPTSLALLLAEFPRRKPRPLFTPSRPCSRYWRRSLRAPRAGRTDRGVVLLDVEDDIEANTIHQPERRDAGRGEDRPHAST